MKVILLFLFHRTARPLGKSMALARLKRLLDIGANTADSIETRRMKRVMLMVHYAIMFGGPVPCIVMYLLIGNRWAAVLAFCTASVPTYLSFFQFFFCPGRLMLSIWIVTLVALFAPGLVVILCGGPKNSGYLPYTFLSPFVWLCVMRKLRSTAILFALAALLSSLYAAVEPVAYHYAVEQWNVSPSMDAVTNRWHYWINLVQMQLLVFLVVASLLLDLAP